jgi:protein involved in polysaccharide export with SLBB domain
MFLHNNPERTIQVSSRIARLSKKLLTGIPQLCRAKVVLSIVVIPLLAPVTGAHAQVENSQASINRSLDELPAVRMTMAQRIALRFRDQPALSGEYHVGPDGTLSIPVIGRIAVADMSLAELEEVLTERVTELTGSPTHVTADVIAYRPIFVTGFVSKPGAVDWYPGLTVLQAEALAGGLYRAPEQTNNAGGFGRVEALRQIRIGHEQQKRLLASLSRLRAEQTGTGQIEIPPTLVSLFGEDEARSLIEKQQSLLDRRRSLSDRQLADIERRIALAAKELEALQDLSIRVSEQLEMRRDMQERIATLLERGLVPQVRSLEGEIHIAQLEEKATDVEVTRARVQSTAAVLKQETVTVQKDREATIDAEIANLESELARATIDLEAAMETYNRLNIGAAQAPSPLLSRTVIRYTIIRRGESGEERILAQTSSYLRPGDVLLVSQETENETDTTQTGSGEAGTGRSGKAK